MNFTLIRQKIFFTNSLQNKNDNIDNLVLAVLLQMNQTNEVTLKYNDFMLTDI